MATVTKQPEVESRPQESKTRSEPKSPSMGVLGRVAVVSSLLCIVVPGAYLVFVYPLDDAWYHAWLQRPWDQPMTAMDRLVEVRPLLAVAHFDGLLRITVDSQVLRDLRVAQDLHENLRGRVQARVECK